MKNSVVLFTDGNQISVTEIYFPAITICPPLIFNTRYQKTVDYTSIVAAIENEEISISNLTMKEQVKPFGVYDFSQNLNRSSLKYMQVISLVTRDGFLSKFNISIPTDDFIETLQSFPKPWKPDSTAKPFLHGMYGNWTKRYVAK